MNNPADLGNEMYVFHALLLVPWFLSKSGSTLEFLVRGGRGYMMFH